MDHVETNSIFHFELEISCVLLETTHTLYWITLISRIR